MTEPRKPWWAEAGFASLQEALDYQDALDEKMLGYRRSKPRLNEPHNWVPGGSIEGAPPRGDETRQVNVRLSGSDHSLLVDLAADYGIATATMARMLLRRGIRAAAGEDG